MGVQDFNPDSEFGVQLKQQISNRLASLNTEDPSYVAEFLLVLISNNRTPAEIVEEFTGLFGAIIDQKFVVDVINEILIHQGKLQPQQEPTPQQSQQQPPQQQQQQATSAFSSANVTPQPPKSAFGTPSTQQQQQQQQQQQPQSQQIQQLPQAPFNIPTAPQAQIQNSMQFDDSSMLVDGAENKEVRFSDATQNSFRPNNFNDNNVNRFNFTKSTRGSTNFKSGRGGRGARGARPLNGRRQDTMSKMVEMSLDNNNEMTTNFVSSRPTERCRDFPHCSNKFCPNAHPTKVCRDFPNCPHHNQTCTYLHPGEDDELFKEYERVREAKFQQRNTKVVNTGITLCKFGSVCQKELCPFGHPTPANKDAKVTILQWCVDNKECKNPNCSRAHSSPNFEPQVAQFNGGQSGVAAANVGAPEKTLEQCKFGSYCKNFRCPKRHATSPVLCRAGASCTRIDCYFQHPINETCRFGVNCTNVNCAFQHPEGRQISQAGATPGGNKVWVNGQNQDSGSTSQRQFAVSEDQVLEQAPPQEA
ncbi:hypothetical protein PICMEDRAFT_17750 [Pichia membranifaciens NRRL Y-2026]|uniref:Uncharacterized protein n=1 Tax=Pichia membranifaciens NRRL Y-2026 TaxID=763406 RepID=A0A1E3NIT1_9ASCO|nr:hypothetical protein PICMEDRAFT_17750 [Pichia membranifaciens NRRL Y-2026]ODQ45263.1 hypothetical protein PICMEDRAFT_17750 [Pichia membranifaciens NRRL Y-2026]